MFQIRRLLELKVQGKSKRTIAAALGISRNIVQRYLSSFESYFADLSEPLTWSDEALDRFIRLPKRGVTVPDPTLADAILDRILLQAHRTELKGGSMRKRKNLSEITT